MTDETAKAARLMKVVEVIVAELDRQGVVETLAWAEGELEGFMRS